MKVQGFRYIIFFSSILVIVNIYVESRERCNCESIIKWKVEEVKEFLRIK